MEHCKTVCEEVAFGASVNRACLQACGDRGKNGADRNSGRGSQLSDS